jgi:hypothetical protein
MQFLKFALAAVTVGSAVAAPAPIKRDTAVTTVFSAVSSVKALVEAELSNIGTPLVR